MDFFNRLLHRNEGGGAKDTAKRDSLSSSLLKGEDSFDKLSECSFTSALSQLKSADVDTDTTADFESAGEQELSPSSSILFEGEKTLVQDPLNFTILSSELEKVHLSTPKNHHPGKGFPFNDKFGEFDIPEDQVNLFARSQDSNSVHDLSTNSDKSSESNKIQTWTTLNETDNSIKNQEVLNDAVSPQAISPIPELKNQPDNFEVPNPERGDLSIGIGNSKSNNEDQNVLENNCLNTSPHVNEIHGLNETCTNTTHAALIVTEDSLKNLEVLSADASLQSNVTHCSINQPENSPVTNSESKVICNKSLTDPTYTNDQNNSEDISNTSLKNRSSDSNRTDLLNFEIITSDSDKSIKNQEELNRSDQVQINISSNSENNFENVQAFNSESILDHSICNKSSTVLTNVCDQNKLIKETSQASFIEEINNLDKTNNAIHPIAILNNTSGSIKNQEISVAISAQGIFNSNLENQFYNCRENDSGNRFDKCREDNSGNQFDKCREDNSGNRFDNCQEANLGNKFDNCQEANSGNKFDNCQEANSGNKFDNCQEANAKSVIEPSTCNKYLTELTAFTIAQDQNNLGKEFSNDKESQKECHLNENISNSNALESSVCVEKFKDSILTKPHHQEINNLSNLLNTSDKIGVSTDLISNNVKLSLDHSVDNTSADSIQSTENLKVDRTIICDISTKQVVNSFSPTGSSLDSVKPGSSVPLLNTEDKSRINTGPIVTCDPSKEKKKEFIKMKPEVQKCDQTTPCVVPSLQNDCLLENEEPPPSLEALSLDFMPNEPFQEDMMKIEPSLECNNSEAGPITADEHISGEFEHPSDLDLDFLSKKGFRKRPPSNLARQSLFVKFDPLVHEQEEEQDSQIMSESEVTSDSPRSEEKTPSKNVQDDILVPITPVQKPPRSTPQSGETPKSKLTNSATAVRQEVLSKEISKLQHLMLQQEHSYEALVTEKVNMLSKAEETIDTLTHKLEQLQSQHPIKLEQRLKSLEESNEELRKENAELTKSRNQYKVIIDEYEKAISQYHSKHERLKLEFDCEKEALIAERDTANRHLANTEMAFNDVHSKYEKCKAAIEKFKANEIILQASIKESAEKIQVMEDRYQKLREHATEKLDLANTELANMKKTHQTEVAKMMALVKKSELNLKSMEGTIEQKNKEIKELTKICDELIEKVNQ